MSTSEIRNGSMRIPFLQKCYRVRLIALMAFMLLGVQLLQHSPLHDHAREIVDCALCHLQSLGDDTEHEQSFTLAVLAVTAIIAIEDIAAPISSVPSPYQGRAPPRLLS
jgi:hypothetical protein